MPSQNSVQTDSKKSFFKKIYKLHVYAGLFVAFHFTVFALTGLPLLFKDEILGQEALATEKPVSTENIAKNYQKIFSSFTNEFPQDRALALFPDDGDPNLIQARLGKEGATQLRGSRRLSYSLVTAKPLQKAEQESQPKSVKTFDWLLELHREFFLGSNGKLYLGLVGLVYTFMLISGFYIYGRFMKGRSLGDIRRFGAARFSDLHKYLGVITFGWALIVALSGVFLAFNGVLIKYFQYQSLQHLSKQYENFKTDQAYTIQLDQVVRTALSEKPNGVIEYISFPDTEFGIPGHFLLLMNEAATSHGQVSELFVIRADHSSLTEVVQLPWYLKFVLWSEPLHFGDYGGLFLKIVWAIFTLMSLAVSSFGVASFILKRRQRKMPNEIKNQIPHKKERHLQSLWLKPSVLAGISILGLIFSLASQGLMQFFALLCVIAPLLLMLWLWKTQGRNHV